MARQACRDDVDAFDIRKLTPEQLMQLGMADLAYVKPVWLNGHDGVCDPRGGRLADGDGGRPRRWRSRRSCSMRWCPALVH